MPTPPVSFSFSLPTGGSITGLTPEIIAAIQIGGVVALQKALDSGTVEYSIGSRSLKRHTLSEILEAIRFGMNSAAAISPDGSTSSIQTRRGVPCDV
jgi:hypothetical protein